MDSIAALRDYKKYAGAALYIPYGHPDTLCPHGELWQRKKTDGDWVEWSNKPWQWDFHAAGATYKYRMQICANRVGKTHSSGAEISYHLTGKYPDWWEGHRFNHPILCWTGSPTNETSRDIVQKELLGADIGESLGTGAIPRHLLVGKPKTRQAGVPDVVDNFRVRHISGGVSRANLKTYEQGWRKWQGTAPDLIALDEEPDEIKIFTEAVTRLITSDGLMMVDYTPLLGYTDLLERFEQMAGKNNAIIINATWDDAPHMTPQRREAATDAYPDSEIEAKSKGVPMMGIGRIFTEAEENFVIPPFELPRYFARICGVDFGIDHPFAASWLAHDRENDIVYLYDCLKKTARAEDVVTTHASAINRRGKWIPVSWPHDGMKTERSGKPLYQMYLDEEVNMLPRSARYDKKVGGAQPVSPTVLDLNDRLATGRFKVFSTCHPWLEEYRMFHRDDKGRIVARKDDALKSSFYALMDLRYADTPTAPVVHRRLSPILSTRL